MIFYILRHFLLKLILKMYFYGLPKISMKNKKNKINSVEF